MGYVITGVIAFFLGASVTQLVLHIKKVKRENPKNE